MMKRRKFFGWPLVGLCFALCLLGCEGGKESRPRGKDGYENTTDGPKAMEEPGMDLPPGKPVTGESIYQLESRWATQRGDSITLSDLAGKPRLVAMVYTHCEYACPMILQNFHNINRELPSRLRSQVGKVLVTFDPDRDTPERLKAYAKKEDLDLKEWTLLQGHPDDILELAMLLGVKYKKTPEGEFSHSNSITLLNGKGEMVYQSQGLKAPARDMVKQVAALF